MSETTNTPGKAPSSLVRKLVWALGILVVLLVVAFFIVTSSGFIKAVVLPKVGAAMNATIEADSISLSPFSQIVVRGVKVKTTGTDSLLEANELRVRYNLMSILKGNYVVDELSLATPKVFVQQNADGTSNLDPLLKTSATPAAAPAKAAAPMQLSLKNVSLTQGSVRYVTLAKNGDKQTIDITGLNASVDQVGNNQSGKYKADMALKLEMQHAAVAGKPAAETDGLQAKISDAYDFKLGADLLPQTISGSTKLQVEQSQGAFKEAANLAAALDCQVTPTEIQKLALEFKRGDAKLGQLKVSGPVDLAKMEGHFKIEVLSLDRQVLNLAGASYGWDFGTTVINTTNVVDVTSQGNAFAISGRLTGANAGIIQNKQATPLLDVELNYQLNADLAKQQVVMRQLSASARRSQAPAAAGDMLRLAVDRPLSISWGGEKANVKESVVNLTVTNLDLNDWGFLAADLAPKGIVSASGQILSQQDGSLMSMDMTAQVRQFSARLGTNALSMGLIQAQVIGKLSDLDKAEIQKLKVEVADGSQSMAMVDAAINYQIKTGEYSVRATFESRLAELLKKYPVAGLQLSAGTAKGSALFTQKAGAQTYVGSVSFSELTGRYEPYTLDKYQVTADFDADLKGTQARINHLTLATRQADQSGGGMSLAGSIDLNDETNAPANASAVKAVQMTISNLDMNENALRPFLASYLAPRTLTSIAIKSPKITLAYDPKGQSAVQGDVTVTNFVMSSTGVEKPKPLAVSGQLDAAMATNALDLKKLVVTMEPTTRAANTVQLQGHLDMAKTNAYSGQFTLASEALDLTPWYDQFATASTNATAPAAAGPEVEPAAMNLPVGDMTVDAKIGRLYVRETAISNLVTTVKIHGSQVDIKPFQLTFNGAPVDATAAVNLGVPGYVYDLSLKADKMPVAPLANSFMAGQTNQYQGDLTANFKIKGAGITGTNLQKNLAGSTSLLITNANISLKSSGAMKTVLKTVLIALRMSDLLEAPVMGIESQTQIGNGTVDVQKFEVSSSTLQVQSTGTVALASVLTNSTLNLPVTLLLSSNIARQSNLYPTNAATNAIYVPLPQFVKIGGTVGKYEVQIDKLVVASILAKNIMGLPSSLAGTVGNTLGSVTNLVNSVKSTNAVQNILGGLLGRGTNAPGNTNAPAANTNSPINTIKSLKNLFR
jgi:hypothetical protein